MRKRISSVLVILGVLLIGVPLAERYVVQIRQKEILNAYLKENSVEAHIDEEDNKENKNLAIEDDLVSSNAIDDKQSDLSVSNLPIIEGLEVIESHDDGREQLNEEERNISKNSKNSKAIGIMEIEKIDLYLPISEGVGANVLNRSLGHMKDSVAIGQVGNCVIAGHRCHRSGIYFERLDELEIDDKIKIMSKGKVHTYIVYDKLVVEPDDLSVTESVGEIKQVTLITCTPKYRSTHRLIIKGVELDN